MKTTGKNSPALEKHTATTGSNERSAASYERSQPKRFGVTQEEIRDLDPPRSTPKRLDTVESLPGADIRRLERVFVTCIDERAVKSFAVAQFSNASVAAVARPCERRLQTIVAPEQLSVRRDESGRTEDADVCG